MAEKNKKVLWFVVVVLILVVGVTVGYSVNQGQGMQTRLLDGINPSDDGIKPEDGLKDSKGLGLGLTPGIGLDSLFVPGIKKEVTASLNGSEILESVNCEYYTSSDKNSPYSGFAMCTSGEDGLRDAFGESDGICDSQAGIFAKYADSDCTYSPGTIVSVHLEDTGDGITNLVELDCEYGGSTDCEGDTNCPWVPRLFCLEYVEAPSTVK